jgi:hypothetical protein
MGVVAQLIKKSSPHLSPPPRPQFLHLDIIEPYFIDEAIDFVYHLASPASPIDYLRLPLHTLKVGSYGGEGHGELRLAASQILDRAWYLSIEDLRISGQESQVASAGGGDREAVAERDRRAGLQAGCLDHQRGAG